MADRVVGLDDDPDIAGDDDHLADGAIGGHVQLSGPTMPVECSFETEWDAFQFSIAR